MDDMEYMESNLLSVEFFCYLLNIIGWDKQQVRHSFTEVKLFDEFSQILIYIFQFSVHFRSRTSGIATYKHFSRITS